jgi:hypothetical protein
MGTISIFPKPSRVELGHYLTAVGLIAARAVAMLARMKGEREKKLKFKLEIKVSVPDSPFRKSDSHTPTSCTVCNLHESLDGYWALAWLADRLWKIQPNEVDILTYPFTWISTHSQHVISTFPPLAPPLALTFSFTYAQSTQSNQQITSIWSKQAEILHGVSN